MADLVLTTLNARYAHASFGLRCLMANLPAAVRARASLREFVIQDRPIDVVEALLAEAPVLVGFGVYIWNVDEVRRVVAMLKALRPEVVVVLGGPEVSHEVEGQPIVALADYVVCGEGEGVFGGLCEAVLRGERPGGKVIEAPPPHLDAVAMPYDLYDADDIAHRTVYVEASRGCPFRCEFCLSSLPIPVRAFPLAPFLAAMEGLIARGVRHFKFVDRTFNLDIGTSRAILEFFLARLARGTLLHFELVPDRLPEELRAIIARFPEGVLQFEVGIQTFDEEVGRRIQRRQRLEAVEDNLRFLAAHTGVHVHADLIVGLPGEGVEGFGRGFDRLVGLGPQEIQVGILKRLRGTPIGRHDGSHGMVYSPDPPYELLANDLLSFEAMQDLRRFARFWDLVANSGNFPHTLALLPLDGSMFRGFADLTAWVWRMERQTHQISLKRWVGLLQRYLVEARGVEPAAAAETLLRDYMRGERNDVPPVLRPALTEEVVQAQRQRSWPRVTAEGAGRRQQRHRGAAVEPVG